MPSNITNTIIDILCSLPAVVLAFTVHEYAHAKVADKLGDPTPRMLGRTRFDPFVHVDPIGLVMLLVVGFGWAKPVQIQPGHFKKPRRDSFLVSVSGVLANAATALVSAVLLAIMIRLYAGGIIGEGVINIATMIISPMVTFNVLLFAFNLLPVPPLDGFQAIRGLSKRPNAPFFQFMQRYGFILLILFVVTGLSSRVVGGISMLLNIPILTIYNLII